MKKNNAFRRAAALMAALSITVSLAAPAFAGTYYIDEGDITIIKNDDGSQTIQQQGKADQRDEEGEETIITTHKEATATLESDLEGPAAEDSGFGPVVEDNYQPAAPAQPEDAEEPKDTDQQEDAEEPKDADQPESTEEPEGTDQPEDAEEPKAADQPESAEKPEGADQQESAEQQAQPQQAALTAADDPATSTPANGFCKNIITVINNAATALKLTLKDVKIDVSDTGSYDDGVDGKAALSVQGKGNVEIELDGDNVLKSGYDRAGLEKNTSTGTLTLKDDNQKDDNQKAGSLTATGGDYGAGIGGGYKGNGKNITIKGGTVNATGGDNGGAGIGGGDYGSGNYGSGKNITIKGGTVTAKGGDCGAGIGGGNGGIGENITITGGRVNATGGWGSAGIGGGDGGYGGYGNGKNITITDGTVTATGGIYGAGIGGGVNASGSNVTVSGAAQVTATAGKSDGYYGAGATIGSGGNETGGQPVDGEEIQADIRGVTTGYIHHIIYEQDGTTIKREWWEPERPQPNPESPQPNPEDPNAPAGESNEVSLGTPGLHVETLEGSLLPFDARRQGSTLRVTSNTLAARLHGTRQALETLQEQGVEQIEFVTSFKTTTLPVADLLAEGGSWFALEHNGLVSRQLSAAQAESLECQMR